MFQHIYNSQQRYSQQTSDMWSGAELRPFCTRNGLLFLWAAGLYGDPEPPDHQALDELIHQEEGELQ